ncbi:MAG: protein phosphatase CheZ [Rhodospirillaceae bacterium]
MANLSIGLGADKSLRGRLDQAKVEARTPLSQDEVSAIVHQVLASMSGDISASDLRLYKELEELARYIQHAKAEIASIRPQDIRESHIPAATDELDAVIGATEAATNTIMDACDTISGLAGNLDPEHGAVLIDCVTRVFEACNFQDVTGQRITKVVKTLKTIEGKVDALIVAFGEQAGHSEVVAARAEETVALKDPDSALLHGPSLPGAAIDQDEIDRLLASFD